MITWRQLLLGPTLWAIVLLVTLSPAHSWAEDLAKFCTEAQSLLKQNQSIQALEVMRRGVEEVWNQMPFQATKNVFVKEKVSSYGMYDIRPSNVYKLGETIRLYVEPVGFTQKKIEDQYLTALEGDFALAKEDGTVIGRKENFFRNETKGRAFQDHFYVNLDYTIKDIPAGNYVIKTVIKDLGSSKKLSINTPVRME